MRRLRPGSPEPLGLTLAPGGANVAVFSAHASGIELCLFDADSAHEVERIRLPERTGDVHHAFVPGIAAGQRYGLRAHGPWDPRAGHRFDPAKLLVDPYATALDRPFRLAPAQFSLRPDGRSRNDDDSAPWVPRAIARALPPSEPSNVRVRWADTVVYELHVRGYTKRLAAVPEALRGTCAGLAHPAAVEHLVRLGVTTIELMPLAASVDERHLPPLGLANYWRYNPVTLLAPEPWLAPGGDAELQSAIAALHAAGIEVLLDVVFNHSGEGDTLGPTLSLRGLDNATYYRLDERAHGSYVNDTGCGNTLALDRPPVLRLAMDALRRFAALGFDGFRFDLATTLGRCGGPQHGGFDPTAPLLQAIAQDPLLRELKLIAEPWDVGPGGYQLGAFAAGWGEWNDAYRDTVRRCWRGDRGVVGALATRLAGSADVFGPRARPLSRSVNFVTAHDGFTLADLVSHVGKHNEANGEDNRDGADTNLSWNHGVEGTSDDPAIVAARVRDVRNLLATLLVSRGTPMLSMGDELGRTQLGNNNAYAQDNAITWIDWDSVDAGLVEFTSRAIAFRKAHPAVAGDAALTGRPVDASGIPDVEWRRADGAEMNGGDWDGHEGSLLVAALYAPECDDRPADRVAIAVNARAAAAEVRWPTPRPGMAWRVELDTAAPPEAPTGGRANGANAAPTVVGTSAAVVGTSTVVAARSVLAVAEHRVSAAAGSGSPSDAHGGDADGSQPQSAVGKGDNAAAGVEPGTLARLAAAAGIAPRWQDVAGRWHDVGPDTTRALLAAMGLEARSTVQARERLATLAADRERRLVPHSAVVRAGASGELALPAEALPNRAMTLVLTGEDGAVHRIPVRAATLPERVAVAADGRDVVQRIVTLPPLPGGYHAAAFEHRPEIACRIVATPERCHLPADLADGARRFGITGHLYALARTGDQGIGDFTTLAELGAATAAVGGAVVGVNPLHALFAQDRERASPYHPSDRRFLDPIYIDVARAPGFDASSSARRLLDARAAALRRLHGAANVDYPAVWALKRAVLEACFDAIAPDDAEFARFVAAGGPTLRNFAIFEAIAATHPKLPWSGWPAGLRAPDGAGVTAFASAQARAVRFALYLQWVAARQLDAAAATARAAGLAYGFYRDLAVGAAPDGAEAWANGGSGLAVGVSVGAPPDPLAPGGQVWCLPPPIPGAMTSTGYTGFRELLAANMQAAGALRIDHVMGLARLFWVPDGAHANAGAYVAYPRDDLFAVLALESQRARCLVVGEDLGTVPDDFRARMAAADVLSYRVLWFERDGGAFRRPEDYARRAAACVSTHDLPTVAGWWTETDLVENAALGRLPAGEVAAAQQARRDDRGSLVAALEASGAATPGAIDPAETSAASPQVTTLVTAAVHRYACAAASALVLVQADDLGGETVAVNLPGTDRERPNWRRKVRVPVSELWSTPAGAAAAADFASRRIARSAAN